MKMLRYLFAIALVLALTSAAKASPPPPPSFQMVVVDPPSLPGYVNILPASQLADLTITLGACQSGQDPGYAGIGCYTLLNDTGKDITSLQVLVPTAAGTPTCAALEFFSTPTCNPTPSNGDYIIDFSGGTGIPFATDCDHDGDGGDLNSDDFNAPCNAGTIFTIAESGNDPLSDFASLSVIANATPEPSSLWLLATGVLPAGLFFANWRRRDLCGTRG